MFPKSTPTENGTFGSQTTPSKEFSTTNNSSNELSEMTSQTMTTESQPLNSNASIDGNIPPEFNEINEANCFSKSFIIGNALIKEKLFPESSLLSNSCHSYSNEIFIDKNREMLNSLPLNSEFNVPIGGRKPSFDNSASLFINRYAESQSDSSGENADGFSITSLETSTKAVPTSKPENQNEFNLKNSILAKFFEFHEPISPQSTNQNVLIKLFPSNSLTKSNLKKSTSDESFEINDQSMIDIECPSSNFSESFKSTSSKPHNLDIY
uniref:Uncharacterized protein n=1 Tax=Panagrolaimus davidi TaxID=227884 RepID=A0A914QCU4_9BILA